MWPIISPFPGFVVLVALAGCQQIAQVSPISTWHQKCGWKADDYFDDPKVVALCKAIEANDLEEIDRLIVGGADVNAKGKANMTPLLWAFPDNKLDRFERLLEHGADPNVAVESDLNSRGAMLAGDSVTHLSCATSFSGYFEAVFDHGGDPNLIRNGIISNETPLFTLISGRSPNKLVKVRLLISKGTNIDHVNGTDQTPARYAVGFGAQYEIALALLEAGANYQIYATKNNSKLVHRVVEDESRLPNLSPAKRAEYEKLVKWLVDHGESVDHARADMKQWESWSITTGEFQQKMAEEVAARIAREEREKKAKERAENKKD